MSSAIVSNKFAKCDDVIVNFVCNSQTIVKLKEFKEYVEEDMRVVLTDAQAKTLFHQWLDDCYGRVDGQQAIVEIQLDSDNDMDFSMDNLWQTVHDNVEIPKDWEVRRCINCEDISVGNYGELNDPLCEEHKKLAGYCSCGVKEDACPECKPVGCEHPSPEVPYCDKHEQTMFNKDGQLCGGCAEVKEVTIVSDKPEVIDFFDGKTVRDADMLALKDKVETLKDRVMRLEMAMIRINSKVVFEIAKTTEALLSSGPAFPVTMVSKKDILLAFEKLQSTLGGVLVNPI
jgi:hypothetical protein